MTSHKHFLEAIMTGKANPAFALDLALRLLSGIYGAGVRLRRYGYRSGLLKARRLPCVVISIGNLTAGGTGKTPMTIYVAKRVRDMGYRVAVISRGYKGEAEKCGGIVSNERQILMDGKFAGDEPFLLAASLKGIPVLVGQNRYQSGIRAINRFQTEVVILDDAFQHLGLFRDLNLLLLDSSQPFGNGFLLPRGILREPVAAIGFSDAIVMTRSPLPQRSLECPWVKNRPVFSAIHDPFVSRSFSAGEKLVLQPHESFTGNTLPTGKSYYAFSGIARNHRFSETLEEMGADVRGFKGFPDHHFYTSQDIQEILNAAASVGATSLVTTEKDLARLHGRIQLPMECLVIGIRMTLDNAIAFDSLIQNRISCTP